MTKAAVVLKIVAMVELVIEKNLVSDSLFQQSDVIALERDLTIGALLGHSLHQQLSPVAQGDCRAGTTISLGSGRQLM